MLVCGNDNILLKCTFRRILVIDHWTYISSNSLYIQYLDDIRHIYQPNFHKVVIWKVGPYLQWQIIPIQVHVLASDIQYMYDFVTWSSKWLQPSVAINCLCWNTFLPRDIWYSDFSTELFEIWCSKWKPSLLEETHKLDFGFFKHIVKSVRRIVRT